MEESVITKEGVNSFFIRDGRGEGGREVAQMRVITVGKQVNNIGGPVRNAAACLVP